MRNTVRFNNTMFEALNDYIAIRDDANAQRDQYIKEAVEQATIDAHRAFEYRMEEAKRAYEQSFQKAAYDQDQLARNLDNELICILKGGQKQGTIPLIMAIKLHRERTGASLKESKDHCDALVVEIKNGLDARN